jgi:hypothetical protein
MGKKRIKETYTVSLTFTDIDSDNPLEAVKRIIGWIKDVDDGIDAMTFDVIGEISNDKFTVDMSEDEEDAVLPNND